MHRTRAWWLRWASTNESYFPQREIQEDGIFTGQCKNAVYGPSPVLVAPKSGRSRGVDREETNQEANEVSKGENQ